MTAENLVPIQSLPAGTDVWKSKLLCFEPLQSSDAARFLNTAHADIERSSV